jgi:hypothetical protein
MSLEVIPLGPSNPNYPAGLRPKKTQALFPRVSTIGNAEILQEEMLGLFCSVKCPGDLILRTYDLTRALRGSWGRPLRFYICATILAEKVQSVREDDGKLLHKDVRILGPVMRSDQGLSYCRV